MTTATLRLLLIEDEDAHAELVQAAFEDEDVELIHVVNLAAAEAALRDRAPHLVLADWRLPDGEASQMLGRGLPVVIMTSHGNERMSPG